MPFNLGNTRLQKGDAAGAVTAFEQAHELRPDHLLAVNMLAKALAAAGQPDRALSCLNEALAKQPDAPELLFNVGQLCLSLGRPAEAVAHFKRVVALAPNFAPAQDALKLAEAAAAKTAPPSDLKSAQ